MSTGVSEGGAPLAAWLPDVPLLRRGTAGPALALALRAGSLVLAYAVVERWTMDLARLPAASYEGPSIALEVVGRFFAEPSASWSYALRISGLLTLLGVAAAFPRRLLARWSGVESGATLQLLVLAPTVILAWAYSTYHYNLYFDQSHLWDRIALVALAVLVGWRPVLALPFAVATVAIVWQFNHPMGPYSVAEQFLLVRLLLLFFAWHGLTALFGRHRPSDFAFVALTLLGASYFTGGLGKLALGWFSQGDVGLLLAATYGNGWLGFLDPATIGTLTERMLALDPLLVAGTFVLECGAVLCLVRRRVLLFFLASWLVFHLSIFALSGIFFWKWMAVEAGVLLLLVRRPTSPTFAVFSRRHALLSVPLIAGGTAWFEPVDLTWYNSAASYVYRFEAVLGEDGGTLALPSAFFAPYDYQFTQSAFWYLSTHRQLQVTWGATWDRDGADALLEASGPTEVERLEDERGEVFFDRARAERFDGFLRRFIGTYNRRAPRRGTLDALRAPPQLWTFHPAGLPDPREGIVAVRIRRYTSLYHDGRYLELGPVEVRRVDVPPGQPRDP